MASISYVAASVSCISPFNCIFAFIKNSEDFERLEKKNNALFIREAVALLFLIMCDVMFMSHHYVPRWLLRTELDHKHLAGTFILVGTFGGRGSLILDKMASKGHRKHLAKLLRRSFINVEFPTTR